MVNVPCRRFVVKQIFWNPGRTILFLICASGFLVLYFRNETECRENRTLQGWNERISSLYQPTRGLENNKDNVEENTKQRIYCFLFIIILAAPTAKSKERRDVIRKTWLSNIDQFDQKVVAKFVIGTSGSGISEQQGLHRENKVHGDILLLPHLRDSYHNLTLKVLQTFVWINTRIKPFYVLKADDDTFVRVDRLISELKTVNPTTNLYWGFFRGDANVKKHGPWAERKWVLCDKYLPYANGGGYVLSASLVEFIARSADLLQLYNSEDVSVGELQIVLRSYLNVLASSLTINNWVVVRGGPKDKALLGYF